MPVLPSAAPPRLSRSLHAPLLEHSLPAWLSHASTQRRDALKQAAAPVPDWYRQATPEQRTRLNDAAVASFAAQTRLDHTVAGVHSIEAFAEPLLIKALQTHFNVQLDVHKTLLHLKKPVELGVLGIDISSFEVLRLPLLQAALHNFEEAEGEEGAFHASSGFLNETTPGNGSEVRTSLTVPQFIRLCRALDIGALYQAYLKPLLYPAAGTGQALRSAFIDTQKTALAAAAHLALLKKDIRPDDLRMIQAVVSGAVNPRLDGKPVWFRDLSLMKHRLTGCVVFVISESTATPTTCCCTSPMSRKRRSSATPGINSTPSSSNALPSATPTRQRMAAPAPMRGSSANSSRTPTARTISANSPPTPRRGPAWRGRSPH